MNKFICGAFRSDMKGVPAAKPKSLDIPETYELPFQDYIYDQGNRGICVSVSMREVLEWKYRQSNKKLNINIDKFYNDRKDKSKDGMTVREAMEISHRDHYIDYYACIQDQETLKSSIFTNGPCIVCLPVYNYDEEFWRGDDLKGGHALVAIGWDKNGFILRNSWGYGYGVEGLGTISYNDFKYIYELWTVI